MEIYQLKTFVRVAREGSITRASELLFLSQPAVSAHIKSLEEELGMALFERNSRGMQLTLAGQQLLPKAEQLLASHQALLVEAKLLRTGVTGQLRLGSNRAPSAPLLGKLLNRLGETLPEVEIKLEYGSSAQVLAGLDKGDLDAGFYSETGQSFPQLGRIKVSEFGVYLAAPQGWIVDKNQLDWPWLAQQPWICPALHSCCGFVAETLFQQQNFRPAKVVSVDQEAVTRSLIGGGVGMGFLHRETALDAEAKGEVVLLPQVQQTLGVYFGYAKARAEQPLIAGVLQALEAVLD